jgi:anaerobic magnesium-protoporphyrin IX monomethyl ester cyclase
LFSEDRDRAIAIAEGIQRRGLPVHFECETRLDSLDTELLDILYAGGLRAVTFGVEAVEATTLKRVARRPIPPAHQRSIIDYCRKKGIATEAFYVFGFLEDTFDSIRATIRYAMDMNSTFALFKILTPYPGTPLRKRMEPLITETDLQKFDGHTLTFKHPHLTQTEMIFLLGAAYNRFYVRPSWVWSYLGMGGAGRELLRRFDEYALNHQLANEALFLSSQPPKARVQ